MEAKLSGFEKFIDEMRKMDCAPADPSEITDDDKIHRYQLEGDKRGVKSASYCLRTEPDGFAFGWFQSFKQGEVHKWHSKSNRKATDEEKAAWRDRLEKAKKQREAEEKERHETAAENGKKLWAAASTEGSNAYLDRKGVGLNGARMHEGKVVVPVYNPGLVGTQTIDDSGFKCFSEGINIKGGYFPIAAKDEDKSVMVICEGFATGASIRAATGFPVIVAFNAGNLKPVAVSMSKKYPNTRFIIGADNDQWTKNQKGEPWNVGEEKAHQAAVAIGGAQVVMPDVPEDDPDQRTDWDDVYRTDGPDVVKQAFTLPEPMPYEAPPELDEEYLAMLGDAPQVDDEETHDPMAAIRPLGHNRGEYSFFPILSGQIVTFKASQLSSMQSLYMLAPRHFWENHYGGYKVSDSKICAFASANLMEVCHRAGIFQLESTRGVGAWLDNGKPVVNCGDVIVGNGMRQHPAQYHGEAVYESGPRVIHLDYDPLSNKDASKLREICRMLSWRRPQFADMLAGWLVIATVGSALRWRPHIWVTGRSGAGKSTVIDEIIKPILGDIAIKRDGGTTEAGVRKSLGVSGRPYVLDEAESETKAQRIEMEKIISLARRASSGGMVENANATFQVRSCFCFAGINPRVEHVADRSRITQLELMVSEASDRRQKYTELMKRVHETITDTYARRLLARTLENMDTLLHNIEVFSAAAAEIFENNKRAGDQIGPMLAGAFLLTSTKKADPDMASAWIAKQDWNWHTSVNEESDSYKLVTHIMTQRVRYDSIGVSRESAIGDLVALAADKHDTNSESAQHALRTYGLRVKDGELLVANSSPNLRKILADTPYIPWGRTLGDYPGANNHNNKPVYFMAGHTTKVTALPLDAVLGKATAEMPDDDEELPFG